MSKEKNTKIKTIFHFVDGSKHEAVLSVKSGKCEEIMTSVSDQIGKYNVIAFIDKKFTSSQFLMVRDNVKMIEFDPIDENYCEESSENS